MSRFGGGGEKVKERVSEHLKVYFDKYFGLVTSDMSDEDEASDTDIKVLGGSGFRGV